VTSQLLRWIVGTPKFVSGLSDHGFFPPKLFSLELTIDERTVWTDPFTELAELTNGMRFLHDELDREIVDQVTGKNQPKRIIYMNGVYKRGRLVDLKSADGPPSDKNTSKTSLLRPTSWFGSGSGATSNSNGADGFDDKFRYVQAQVYASEKDLEYGFARQQQQDRLAFRKKMIVALLLGEASSLLLESFRLIRSRS